MGPFVWRTVVSNRDPQDHTPSRDFDLSRVSSLGPSPPKQNTKTTTWSLHDWGHDAILWGNDQPFLKGQKETPTTKWSWLPFSFPYPRKGGSFSTNTTRGASCSGCAYLFGRPQTPLKGHAVSVLRDPDSFVSRGFLCPGGSRDTSRHMFRRVPQPQQKDGRWYINVGSCSNSGPLPPNLELGFFATESRTRVFCHRIRYFDR